MKLIKPSFEILEQTPGIQGVKKQIELAGRTCYKSEDKITDTSCEEFVSRMVNSGHGAMLEHGTVYLKIPYKYIDVSVELEIPIMEDLVAKYTENKYSRCINIDHIAYITTNYRVLVENGWLEDLQYQCEPTEHHEKRITVKFTLPISISREFIRHRTASFAEQSTRYCNYSKSKFGSELTFIKPYWYDREHPDGSFAKGFGHECKRAEELYIYLTTECGLKAQEAREFLPLCTKTELVMTAFTSDWKHFFKLRCHSTAHPQARELAIPLKEEFIKKGFINGEYL